MNIHENIRTHRTLHELTQEALAEKLNVTPQAVSRWETGVSYPDITMLQGLAGIFNITVDALLGGVHSQGKVLSKEALDRTQSQIDCIFDYVPSTEKSTGKRILFVDDAPFLRTVIPQMFAKHGHEVIAVEDGEDALDLADKEPFDYCLLDINMPVMNGLEVLTKLKEAHPDIKVIMLTGTNIPDIVEKAKSLGADGYVIKPFEEEELIARFV